MPCPSLFPAPGRSVLQGDGLLRAGADRVDDLGPQRLVRVLLEDHQRVVVLQLEHLGGGRHAQAVALTQVPVNDDSHVGSPFWWSLKIFRRSLTAVARDANPSATITPSGTMTPT